MREKSNVEIGIVVGPPFAWSCSACFEQAYQFLEHLQVSLRTREADDIQCVVVADARKQGSESDTEGIARAEFGQGLWHGPHPVFPKKSQMFQPYFIAISGCIGATGSVSSKDVICSWNERGKAFDDRF